MKGCLRNAPSNRLWGEGQQRPCLGDDRPISYYICSMLAKYVNTYHYNMNIYHDSIFSFSILLEDIHHISSRRTTADVMQFYFIYMLIYFVQIS